MAVRERWGEHKVDGGGSTRQHAAARGSTQQHAAARGSTRQHAAARGSGSTRLTAQRTLRLVDGDGPSELQRQLVPRVARATGRLDLPVLLSDGLLATVCKLRGDGKSQRG